MYSIPAIAPLIRLYFVFECISATNCETTHVGTFPFLFPLGFVTCDQFNVNKELSRICKNPHNCIISLDNKLY